MTPRPDWDPGWKKAILAYRPWPSRSRSPAAGTSFDLLTTVRLLFLTQAVAAVLLIVAFWFIASREGSATWSFWVLGLYALLLHAVLIPFGQRMMVYTDQEPRLVIRYRVRMFTGIGESFTAEGMAIVFTFMGAPFVQIVLGAVITLSGLWRIAPAQRVFRQCDERLAAMGKPIRMTEAWRHLLTDPPLPPPLPI